jgi:hypothetical protein
MVQTSTEETGMTQYVDAFGWVGKTKFKCMDCLYDSSETCTTCGGFGFVCKEKEHEPDLRDELDRWVFESEVSFDED